MKLAFRWFGDKDPVLLQHIRQIPGVEAVVTQIKPDVFGEVIPYNEIEQTKRNIEAHGMSFKVFESLPLHYSILLGSDDRDNYIAKYKENLKRLGNAGVEVVVYNFRPIIRWARTEIYKKLDDGSTVSEFNQLEEARLDPFVNKVEDSKWYSENSHYIYERQLTTDLELEGYYTKESLKIMNDLRDQYQLIGKEGLWKNLEYFLNEIIPIAEESGLKMAIHPDDPPWDIFRIPRLITSEKSLDRLMSLYESESNGIAFCSGTIGSNHEVDVVKLASKYLKMKRVPFAHIRNVLASETAVQECAHYSPYGSIDMVALLKVFSDHDYGGYIRSDHGRMIWGEEGKPGNGIYDRALGAQYILGIWECLGKLK